MSDHRLKVAWISYFPVEWLPDLPEALRHLPKQHPATWQRVLLDEFKTVPGLELHVIVVRKQFPESMSFVWNGVTFHCLKLPGGMRTLSLFWWETLLIRRALKQINPDLVHAWGSERGASLVASRLNRPYLVTMQGLLQWINTQTPLSRPQKIEAALEPAALRRASVVTCESSFSLRWLKERYPHLQVLQAEHAPNWLFHKIPRNPVLDPISFLFVGSLGEAKGCDLLLLALNDLLKEFDFRLTIIGSEAPGFLDSMRKVTLPDLWRRIQLLQPVSPGEIAQHLSCAAMLIYPTRADSSPNSVKEAVVAGVPVVASAVGGIVDYVVPGKNGMLFPSGDRHALADAIRSAVKHPLFREGRVDAVTGTAMKEYLSPERMKQNFLNAYATVLKKG